jgi:iron complex outermembrane receptor protein
MLLVSSALLGCACSLPAMARSADGTVSLGADTDVAGSTDVDRGDIIVTARKRAESSLKVPVVEAVLPADVLAKSQVVDIHGIANLVPGLTLGDAVLTVGTQISLRGIGTSSLDAGVDQSVSVNIDGMQFTQGSTFNVGLFDMSNVEVLKGPQALFYGKSSPGGVIAIHTNDPGPKAEIIGSFSYGLEAHEKRGELIVSGPVTDRLGVRIASSLSGDDGYFFNAATADPGTGAQTPGPRYDLNRAFILRGTVVWKPSSDFTAKLKINHAYNKVIGGGEFLGSCPTGDLPGFPPFINPSDPCKHQRTIYLVDVSPAAFPNVPNNGVPFLRSNANFGTLDLTYNLSPHIDLRSTTGYARTTAFGFINGTDAGYAAPPIIAIDKFARRDFTQELRLESDYTTPLNFLMGAFYQRARMSQLVDVVGDSVYFAPIYQYLDQGTLTAGINDIGIKDFSLFGQLRYKPVEKLEIAAGARWSDEKRHDDASSLADLNATPVPTPISNPNVNSKKVSPEVTLTYTATNDLTVFGDFKQGYKSGSFIITIPATPNQDNSFGDEKIVGGELGIKSRLADRAINLNLAGYYYKYTGLQVGANTVAVNGIPTIRTLNAGTAKIYGVDFDMTYHPPQVEGLSMRLGVNYNHARFTHFDNAECSGGETIADGCNLDLNPTTGFYQAQNLAGLPLPKAPDWQINGGVNYEIPIGRNWGVNFGATGDYSSRYLNDLGNRSDFYQQAYFKLGANITARANSGAWEVSIIGNNLTDKYTSGNCINFAAATGSVLLAPETGGPGRNAAGVVDLGCSVDPGRQVFLRLTLRPLAR